MIDLRGGSREAALDQVERGEADWSGGAPPPIGRPAVGQDELGERVARGTTASGRVSEKRERE